MDGVTSPPFTWELETGTLPPGLSLAPPIGNITGTPPDGSAGTYTFTLRVTDADGLTAASEQQIEIAPGCQAPPGPCPPVPVPVPACARPCARACAEHTRRSHRHLARSRDTRAAVLRPNPRQWTGWRRRDYRHRAALRTVRLPRCSHLWPRTPGADQGFDRAQRLEPDPCGPHRHTGRLHLAGHPQRQRREPVGDAPMAGRPEDHDGREAAQCRPAHRRRILRHHLLPQTRPPRRPSPSRCQP